jgi:hypothetical protein
MINGFNRRLQEYKIIIRILSDIPSIHELKMYQNNIIVNNWRLIFRHIDRKWLIENETDGKQIVLYSTKLTDHYLLYHKLSQLCELKQLPHSLLIFRKEGDIVFQEFKGDNFAKWLTQKHTSLEWQVFLFQYLYFLMVLQEKFNKTFWILNYHEFSIYSDINKGHYKYQLLIKNNPPVIFYVPITEHHFVFCPTDIRNYNETNGSPCVEFLKQMPSHIRFLNIYLNYSLSQLVKKAENEPLFADFYSSITEKFKNDQEKIKEAVVDFIISREQFNNMGYSEKFIVPPDEIINFLDQLPFLSAYKLLIKEFNNFQILDEKSEEIDSFLIAF